MDFVKCPSDAAELPSWLCSVGNSWAGVDQGVGLDVSSAAWLSVPGQLVDVLRKMRVKVLGVCTGDKRPLPHDVVRLNGEGGLPFWAVAEGYDILEHTQRIRGGQVVSYDGDVLIRGDVPAGAEVFAGGSVFVSGDLRGRVTAGEKYHEARVISRSFQPEMVCVAGKAVAGDRIPKGWWGDRVMVSLNDDKVRIDEAPDCFG